FELFKYRVTCLQNLKKGFATFRELAFQGSQFRDTLRERLVVTLPLLIRRKNTFQIPGIFCRDLIPFCWCLQSKSPLTKSQPLFVDGGHLELAKWHNKQRLACVTPFPLAVFWWILYHTAYSVQLEHRFVLCIYLSFNYAPDGWAV